MPLVSYNLSKLIDMLERLKMNYGDTPVVVYTPTLKNDVEIKASVLELENKDKTKLLVTYLLIGDKEFQDITYEKLFNKNKVLH